MQCSRSMPWRHQLELFYGRHHELVIVFLHFKVHPLVINPKSVTLSELYGAYDLSTFEWADGILSTLFKQSAESDKPDEKVAHSSIPLIFFFKWVVCLFWC